MFAHAIIRHRLMDIRVVVKRGAVFLAAVATVSGILVAVLVALNVFLPAAWDFTGREILLALAVALLFQPLKGRIQVAFDRYVYRDPYDYRRVVRETSQALAASIELPVLLGHVGRAVATTLRPEGVAVYLLDPEEGELRRAWRESAGGAPAALALSSPVLKAPGPERRPIFRDELRPGAPASQDAEMLGELDRLGAEVVVPLVEEDEVIGLLCVGPKRSGDPYFSDDADLLTTLANQSAVAIRNAQTHQRVVRVNEEVQKILATIESGVIAVGPRGRITLFNRAAEQLTGVAAQTVRGRQPAHLPAPLAQAIEGTVADGQPRTQLEFALPDAAGQLIPLVCSTSPLRDPQGGIAGAVAVVSDLSRLKELEQEKRRAERLASLEAIASGLVHEIRNPLVAIKTFSQLLPSKGESAEFRETFSRVASREIGRIDELLTRFRTLAAVSAQSMELVDVLEPMRDTLETLRPRLEEQQIRLRRVADGAPRPILGNASQLEQLFMNLCLNAIEAMEPGGELTVRVADLCASGGTTLLVEVSDTGPGVPEDMLLRIFEPFVTTKMHGTGLGLAICRGIADAHHARLTARNNTGRPGCTFTIEFPVPVARPTSART